MKLHSMIVLTALALLLAVSASACSPAPAVAPTAAPASTSAPQAATTAPTVAPTAGAVVLRVGALPDDYRQDPKEPGRITIGMATVNTNIFDTLTRMDENYQVQPMLAESWEFMAPTTWRFHLRKDVKFHNGQPFTSKAVVEDIKRLASGENATFAGILQVKADSAKAVDDFTVDITTTGPVLLPAQLVHPIFGIPAPGTDLLKERIGTGPFKEVEYIPKDHITVAKNPDYWGPKAKVDQIVFRFFPDPNTRLLALQAGQEDLIYDVPRESASLIEGKPGLKLINGPVSAYQAVTFLINGKDPYTIGQDPKVREAVGYAIDRKNIIDTAFDGRATDSQTIIPASILGKYASEIAGFTFDPAKAAKLLDDAGWKVGSDGVRVKNGKKLKLELVCCFPDPPSNGRTSELLQAQLKKVGIDLSIVNMPDDIAYDNRLTEQKGDLWLEIGNQNSAAPCFLPSFLYYGGGTQLNNYQLAFNPHDFPELNKSLDDCSVTSSADQAAKDAADVMQIMVDKSKTALPILALYRIWGVTDKVQGFTPPPVFLHVRWEPVSLQP
jgi:peptide/nickel transport system substrate-binding protein